MQEPIINKVKANTKLVTIDLAKLFYDSTPIAELDIKQFLHMEMLLKEKDFRQHLKDFDWSQFEGKILICVLFYRCDYCSMGLDVDHQLCQSIC